MVNTHMNFKLFYEAREDFIEKIKDAIDKVDERPFNELFGKKDRFLVELKNTKLSNAFLQLQLDEDTSNETHDIYSYLEGSLDKRKKLNTLLKHYLTEYENRLETLNKESKDAFQKIMEENKGLSRLKYIIKSFYKTHNFVFHKGVRTSGAISLKHKDYYEERPFTGIPAKMSQSLPWKDYQTIKPYDVYKVLKKMFLNHEYLSDVYISNTELQHFRQTILGAYNRQYANVMSKVKNQIKNITQIKDFVTKGQFYDYLLFSRHPVDVLRMSNHKGISSCHRLSGKYSSDEGGYADCALADAQNSGGIVYFLSSAEGQKVKKNLDKDEIFEDKDRNVAGAKPSGRLRLRRFIDLETGDDFAIPTMDTSSYGSMAKESLAKTLEILREKQSIYKNPPTQEYASDNIVMVGGTYSDESLSHLFDNFFNVEEKTYRKLTHKNDTLYFFNKKVKPFMDKVKHLNSNRFTISASATRRSGFKVMKIDLTYASPITSQYLIENKNDIAQALDLELNQKHYFDKSIGLGSLIPRKFTEVNTGISLKVVDDSPMIVQTFELYLDEYRVEKINEVEDLFNSITKEQWKIVDDTLANYVGKIVLEWSDAINGRYILSENLRNMLIQNSKHAPFQFDGKVYIGNGTDLQLFMNEFRKTMLFSHLWIYDWGTLDRLLQATGFRTGKHYYTTPEFFSNLTREK